MEVDASLTSDLQLVALHDRDLQRLLGQPDAKVRLCVLKGGGTGVKCSYAIMQVLVFGALGVAFE